jgi:hypothetical protein
MPIRDFPFLNPHPGDLKKRPWLFINIGNPKTGSICPTFGLIDTGSDECALPASYADLLGHNLTSGEPKQICTGNGVTTAYRHTCSIQIFDTNKLREGISQIAYTIDEILIDFMPNLHCALLGVSTFLSNFIVIVNYPKQVFSIIKPE